MKITYTAHGIPRDLQHPSQDAFRVQESDGGIIAALADGVGSSKEGGAAAQRAVTMFVDQFRIRPHAWSARRAMGEFAAQINRILHLESQEKHSTPELLCTLSVISIEGDQLFGVCIGDSPVFRWRNNTLTRLAEPHTMHENGMEHVLTRAIGLEPTVQPTFFESDVQDGDIWLLCSDGVSHPLAAEQLESLLQRRSSARTLVSTAREITEESDTPRDDTTAIVIEVIQHDWHPSRTSRPLEIVPELHAGEKVDQYTLVRSMQETNRVWLAQLPDGTRHILKFPPLEAASDETRRDAFVREMWNACRIQSPDFAHSFAPPEGPLRYYGMEYIEAPTLREVLQKGYLPVEDAIELTRCLLRAEQLLVSFDHVHGDIKPDNILVLRTADSSSFRLLDLGSAVEVFSINTRAGTPSYLAPERFHGAAISERTEVYAIGATLYEALTGSCPYGEIERFQTPRFVTPPKLASTINPSVPPWLNSLIQRSLSIDINSRYQAFSEMSFELEHPEKVQPFHQTDAPLFERNPVLVYKIVCALLLASNLFLLHKLFTK